MKRPNIYLTFFVLFVATSTAYAHDEKFHKGKPTHGTVTQLNPQGFDLKSGDTTFHVTLNVDTKIERGDSQASKDDIEQGQPITVFGTKLESGELVAKEILLESTNSNPCPPGNENCKHGMGMGMKMKDMGQSHGEHSQGGSRE